MTTIRKYYGDKTMPRTDVEIKLQAARDSMLEYTQAMAAMLENDDQAAVDAILGVTPPKESTWITECL